MKKKQRQTEKGQCKGFVYFPPPLRFTCSSLFRGHTSFSGPITTQSQRPGACKRIPSVQRWCLCSCSPLKPRDSPRFCTKRTPTSCRCKSLAGTGGGANSGERFENTPWDCSRKWGTQVHLLPGIVFRWAKRHSSPVVRGWGRNDSGQHGSRSQIVYKDRGHVITSDPKASSLDSTAL